MKPPLGLYAYPWDIIDEGAEVVLDAVERAGLNTLYLTTWYHSGMFFLPHNPRRRTYFPTPGALYYRPGAWHRSHKLAPPISDLTDNWQDFWPTLADAARRRDVSLTAWMPVLHNSGVGTAHPEVVVENPWGDRITHTLCPSNGQVGDLVLSVMEDIASMGVFDRILIESIEYLPLRHGHHHEVIGVPLDADIEFLSSLCFCPACMRRLTDAGVDFHAVRAWVRQTVDDALAGKAREPMGWAELEAGADGAFGSYLKVRGAGPTDLIVEAAATIRRNDRKATIACLDFGPLYPLGPHGRCWQNGNDLDRIIPAIDELHPTFYFTDPDTLTARVETYSDVVGDGIRQVPAIRAILPQTNSPTGLADQLAATKARASGFTFYNYSFMALDTLEWIRDGLASHPPAQAEGRP
ncbi:MAG: hypothetical protein JJ920_11925 [Roseitalea sp.]|jgi:hypothetical protein|nr:hypothetical protein [Roseitalea sp.]MBO6720464.1 hypothetical protein [Roseitalea sp.]MBO6743611.1 hypothetical protein [Roseitalea sp.]